MLQFKGKYCEGTKRVWLQGYRNLKRVKKIQTKARRCVLLQFACMVCLDVANTDYRICNCFSFSLIHDSISVGWNAAVVANLNQNPQKMPICQTWLPALLRNGLMYLILLNPGAHDTSEERWMLPKEQRMRLAKQATM